MLCLYKRGNDNIIDRNQRNIEEVEFEFYIYCVYQLVVQLDIDGTMERIEEGLIKYK